MLARQEKAKKLRKPGSETPAFEPGVIKRVVDIGFSHLFHHEFSVADIDYGILGIDFLREYHLTVDVSNNKLTASIDPERCKWDLVNEYDGLEVGFTLRSD